MRKNLYANNSKIQREDMFDSISSQYDFLNRLLSFRMDIIWRRKTVKYLAKYSADCILDVATGTGDLAIELSKLNPKKIIGIDISTEMLKMATKKIAQKELTEKIELMQLNIINTTFPNNFFDIITCAFGVRNFLCLEKGLAEMNRVLKPGGVLYILEFSQTRSKIISLYLEKILPKIGRIISKNKEAYSYLVNSIKEFPKDEEFIKILKNCNFQAIDTRKMNFGNVSLYIVSKI